MRTKLWIAALAVGSGASTVALGGSTVIREPGDSFSLMLSERVTRDANLYRLPDAFDAAAVIPGGQATRDDLVRRTSASIDGGWSVGKQEFLLNAAVDDNRYTDNTPLDNTSGNGRADWNWQVGRDWSGQLGAGYGRSLAGFVNSRFFGKDVLETSDYHGTLEYELTPHWTLLTAGRYAEGAHDSDARRADDFTSRSSTFGINYVTQRGDEMGLQYRRTETRFPNLLPGADPLSDRNYVDRAASVEMSHAFTVKTSFQGSVGYLWRHYPRSVLGDFAGPVWNAALRWEPRARTRIEITQFQELTAYLDAESNHFEARGTRLSFLWLPTARITVSLDASREKHDYSGFEPGGIDAGALAGPARRDRLADWQAGFRYSPVERLALDVSYRVEQRETNRLLYAYDDRVIAAGLTLIF